MSLTMYALVRNNEIVQWGPLPYKIYANDRWYDLRDPANIAPAGYVEVVEVEGPVDTETTVSEYTVELVGGVPTQVWTQRNKTPEELQAEEDSRLAEERRQTEAAIIDATIALMENAHTDGEAWSQPTGAHNAYKVGVTVEHNEKTWENITPANVWEPGVTGWREVAVDGPVAWIQPLGAHEAYPLGATVTHNGQTWESTVAGNVWEPGVYGWERR